MESNKHLFDGLNIMKAGDKYTSLQEQYPVIFLTLKFAKQPDFELAYACLIDDIADEFIRHSYILDCDEILEEYAPLLNEDAFPTVAWSNTSSNNIVKDLIERGCRFND